MVAIWYPFGIYIDHIYIYIYIYIHRVARWKTIWRTSVTTLRRVTILSQQFQGLLMSDLSAFTENFNWTDCLSKKLLKLGHVFQIDTMNGPPFILFSILFHREYVCQQNINSNDERLHIPWLRKASTCWRPPACLQSIWSRSMRRRRVLSTDFDRWVATGGGHFSRVYW